MAGVRLGNPSLGEDTLTCTALDAVHISLVARWITRGAVEEHSLQAPPVVGLDTRLSSHLRRSDTGWRQGGDGHLPTNIFACFRVGLPAARVGTVEDKVAA